jgi:hypothetical protein
MFTINDDLSIYVTRGDKLFFTVTAEDDGSAYVFQPGDIVRFKVYGKKDATNVVLQKDFPITTATEKVEIYLTEDDTKIGSVISKPKDYWYEVELNPYDHPQTIIGYDEDGAKVFRLLPEGRDMTENEPDIKPEDIPVMDKVLDMTSLRPVQNQAIARAVARLDAAVKDNKEAATDMSAELAVERARVDNLLFGATADGAEVVDIRVGADGVTYGSAGAAVRTQFNKVKGDLHGVEDAVYNRKTSFNATSFKLLQKDASDFSARYEGRKLYIDGEYATASDMLAYVDASDCVKTSAVVGGGIVVYQYLHLFLARTEKQFLAVRFMGDGTARLQNVTALDDGTFIGSALETATANATPADGDNVTIEYADAAIHVYVNEELSVSFDISGYGGAKIRGVWIPNYNAVEAADKAIAVDVAVYGESAVAVANKTEKSCYGKYHMSFDDVYLVLKDLTENANTYTSIFENEFLAWLKKMHETYGVKFSLYCFYTDTSDGWTMDDATTAFAAEFKENADWLRFGFHAHQQGINYAEGSARHDKAAEDYTLTINALVNITGSHRCIDRMPRLHNYAGTLEACKALRDVPCGCVGFLTAMDYSVDEGRDSYYFDADTNKYMHLHDYYFDAFNQLHFVKTSLSSGYGLDYSELMNNVKYANINRHVELFTHENQLTDGMKTYYESVIAALAANGYKSVFWMDEIN